MSEEYKSVNAGALPTAEQVKAEHRISESKWREGLERDSAENRFEKFSVNIAPRSKGFGIGFNDN